MNQEVLSRIPNSTKNRPAAIRKGAKCEVHDGIPTTDVWGYYTSRGGTRMLVLECRLDERIRINGEIEIVVLGAGNEEVRLGVESTADRDEYVKG